MNIASSWMAGGARIAAGVNSGGQANLADVAATDGPQHLTNLKADYDGLSQAKAGQQRGTAVQIDILRLDV